MKLKGKIIIVFGATGGLGYPLSDMLKLNGANLALVARKEDKLKELLEHMKYETFSNAEAIIIPGDAGKIEDVRNAFKKTLFKFGKVDGVIISTGSHEQISIENTPEEVLSSVNNLYNSMFLPALIVGSVAREVMLEQKHGVIFHISSWVVKELDLKKNDTYRAMKMAASSFIRDIGKQLKPFGVRVCDLQPGTINTAGNEKYLTTEEKRMSAIQPKEIAGWIIENFTKPDLPIEHLFVSGGRY